MVLKKHIARPCPQWCLEEWCNCFIRAFTISAACPWWVLGRHKWRCDWNDHVTRSVVVSRACGILFVDFFSLPGKQENWLIKISNYYDFRNFFFFKLVRPLIVIAVNTAIATWPLKALINKLTHFNSLIELWWQLSPRRMSASLLNTWWTFTPFFLKLFSIKIEHPV